MNLSRTINDDNGLSDFTFLNPFSYLFYRKNKKLFSHFKIHVDGILLVKLFHLFGFMHIERKSFDMTSMAPIVFNDAIVNNKSIYFIGSNSNEIVTAVEVIKENFLGLNIIGYRDGYFRGSTERLDLISKIKKLNPAVVVCGMGTPLQEKFLIDLRDSGWMGTGYTCGGFLHQTAGGIDYYPEWIDKYNLRWAYRIYDEPKLFKRYFIDYPKSVTLFVYDMIKYKLSN